MQKIKIIFLFLVFAQNSYAYLSEKAGFTIHILGETNAFKIYSVFVLPDSEFSITSESDILLSGQTVDISQTDSKSWMVRAPGKSGVYTLKITNTVSNEMQLNILVLTPISEKKGEYLNGYRIGNYPINSSQSNPIYNRPKGFFEVNEDNQDILLTPHFTIKQFLCKQQSGFPKYLIVRERLLLKLEYLLEKANEKGFEIETFGFISGFRTPYYNKVIKNVSKSRHIYGGAADIYIDQDKDGNMDDLNRDGITDYRDVKIFYDTVESEFGKPSYEKFKGGLGIYRKNGRHHGFIHVDVRGWKARW